MTNTGIRAYSKVAVESGVESRDPHGLVLMLYDGAIEAIRQASHHLAAKRVPEKCGAIGKALRIVEEGLRASVDSSAGGALAAQLISLYEYMAMRLLQANLRNDAAALGEVIKLLEELRGAWVQIRTPGSAAVPAAPAAAAAVGAKSVATPAAPGASAAPAVPAAVPAAVSPAARFFDAAYPQPLRRVATA